MFEDKHVYIAAHTLAQTAFVQLYRPFIKDSTATFTKCSQAARACVSVIKQINERDYSFLDPIIGPCWSFIGDTLMMELEACKKWSLDTADVRSQVTTVLYAMGTLSPRMPIVGMCGLNLELGELLLISEQPLLHQKSRKNSLSCNFMNSALGP